MPPRGGASLSSVQSVPIACVLHCEILIWRLIVRQSHSWLRGSARLECACACRRTPRLRYARRAGIPRRPGNRLVSGEFLNLLNRRAGHRDPRAEGLAIALPDVAFDPVTSTSASVGKPDQLEYGDWRAFGVCNPWFVTALLPVPDDLSSWAAMEMAW
jgi:hypothetical protein